MAASADSAAEGWRDWAARTSPPIEIEALADKAKEVTLTIEGLASAAEAVGGKGQVEAALTSATEAQEALQQLEQLAEMVAVARAALPEVEAR